MVFQYFEKNLTHQVIYLYILPGDLLNLRDQRWKCTYFDAELAFVAGVFLSKYLFPVLAISLLNLILSASILSKTALKSLPNS